MTTPGLVVEGLTIAYGGNTVVSSVDLQAPMGRITGLIGPNGAGKTSTFNACSGLVKPKSGTVRLFGQDVTGVSPARRARLGLGRTFQRLELCSAMTVRENVLVGCEARVAGSGIVRQLRGRRGPTRDLQARVDEAIERCGLSSLASRPLSSLSTGRRRLVELARALAAGFEVLLLDEPSSGLDDAETAQMGQVLQAAVRDRGIGLLLVEHDMSLVMRICEHIFVLNFGNMVFEGGPAAVQASPVVRSAYLGEAETAVSVP